MKKITKQAHAARALRNAMTRAENHLAEGDIDKALVALTRGEATARNWMMSKKARAEIDALMAQARELGDGDIELRVTPAASKGRTQVA